jgi:single-stranded-DNA-specific exonuclease
MLTHPISKKKIVRRAVAQPDNERFVQLHPVLSRIYQARELCSAEELDRSLARLPSPWLLSGMETMVQRLLQALEKQRSVLILADYDADGATSCAVGMEGLRLLGFGRVSYLVPNRFEYGYGLTPEIVEVASRQSPDLILTVDNGIASLEGVEEAHAHGMEVLITDHHLPGETLPAADAIVNPNLPGDSFPSKCLAGVGVMFYVLMALRARMREMGGFSQREAPNLARLLDYVALGTVADVVPLDHANRILVHQGLQRIRAGQSHPGVLALIEAAGRNHKHLSAADLSFAVAPRLNAAGRLEDMSLGIECLLASGAEQARAMAVRLDELNRDRREIEERMKLDALAFLDQMSLVEKVNEVAGICLFDESWHQGVIGILASRIKDRLHRPVIAFAPGDGGDIKGSARSIEGIHIRDVLSDIAVAHPALLQKFGGHAMAAGLSLRLADLSVFAGLFNEAVGKRLNGFNKEPAVHTDGALDPADLQLELSEVLRQAGPWGQGFPEPLFDGEFEVVQARVLGARHLKLLLRPPGHERVLDAIAFFVDAPERWLGSRRVRAAYRLEVNDYRNQRALQLNIEYLESLDLVR